MLKQLTLLAAFLVLPYHAFAMSGDETVRIQLKPEQETKINAPMSGLITSFNFKDGEVVEKGQILATFECTKQKAQYAQSQARVKRQESLLLASKKLHNLGSASITDIGVLTAELSEAKAARDLANAQIKDCTIYAPFNGTLSAVHVKNYYSAEIGTPLLELVGNDTLVIEMIVSSKWIPFLTPETEFSIEIDETGKKYDAIISRLGGRVDPVTQSLKAYAALKNSHQELRPGMSGRAIFPNREEKAADALNNSIHPSTGP